MQTGDRFRCGEVLVEVTQIGKKCHGPGCANYESGIASCPRGNFARVLSGGLLNRDELI